MKIPKGWMRHATKELVSGEVALYVRKDAFEDPAPNMSYGLIVTANEDGKYYLSPASSDHAKTGDRRGPFETLKEACSAADTVIGLNGVPEDWHY